MSFECVCVCVCFVGAAEALAIWRGEPRANRSVWWGSLWGSLGLHSRCSPDAGIGRVFGGPKVSREGGLMVALEKIKWLARQGGAQKAGALVMGPISWVLILQGHQSSLWWWGPSNFPKKECS